MSKRESSDPGMPGYFLLEDSQLRLVKLSEHIGFLARLAQPRTYAERESALDVPVGELATCLEWLAEQVDLALEAMSWSTPQQIATDAADRDAMSAMAPAPLDTPDDRFVFGITLAQIDTLHRMIQTISAHGDILAAGHTAELADHTLPLLGHAIFDAAEAARAILDQVETQRIGQEARPRTDVGEERGMYAAGLMSLAVDGPPRPVLPPSTHRPPGHAWRTGRAARIPYPPASSIFSTRARFPRSRAA